MLGRNTANKLKTTSPSPIHVSCPTTTQYHYLAANIYQKSSKQAKTIEKLQIHFQNYANVGVFVCAFMYIFVYYLSSKSVFVKLLADIHIKFSILYLHCGVWVFYASTTQNMAYPEAIFILYAPNDLQTISPF